MHWRLYLTELRYRHWIKNVLIFAPAFFTFNIKLTINHPPLILAFIAFCVASSWVYVFNDLQDIEFDKLSTINKDRPYAMGYLNKKNMYIILVVLTLLLVPLIFTSTVWQLIFIYLAINVLYSSVFKHIVLLDISVICFGFLLRVWAGALAIAVPLSGWLISITLATSLFLAFSKRRSEVFQFSGKLGVIKNTLLTYSKMPIRIIMIFLALFICILYLLYSISPEVTSRLGQHIYLTFSLVLAGMLRYLYYTFKINPFLPPADIIWKDLILQCIIAGWVFSLYLLIY